MATNKNQININNYIPEVYKSEIADNLRETAFNPHLSTDNTIRSAGVVGDTTAVDRIVEPTPHRQISQLSPVMYNKIGTEETAMSYSAFLDRLAMMGVDISTINSWGSSKHFNWAPPVNLDKLVNYQNYFWTSKDTSPRPQYLTIENRCEHSFSATKLRARAVAEYGQKLTAHADIRRGTITMTRICDDAFAEQDVVHTVAPNTNGNATAMGILGASFWTIKTVRVVNGTTVIAIDGSMYHSASDAPPSGYTVTVGMLWLDTTTDTFKVFNGSSWVQTDEIQIVDVDIDTIRRTYEAKSLAVCDHIVAVVPDSPMDNTTLGDVLWQPGYLEDITFPTSAAWIQHNDDPVSGSIWYDTNTDTIKQMDATAIQWLPRLYGISHLLKATRRELFKPMHISPNAWTVSNTWVHKDELTSFTGVQRAQVPIIEFDASVELNGWAQVQRTWKYRATPTDPFEVSDTAPSRFELEPVRDYVATKLGGVWTIYMFGSDITTARDMNLSSIFVPGYKFAIEGQTGTFVAYTVRTSVFRGVMTTDPVNVQTLVGTTQMVTVVTIEEPTFSSAATGGAAAAFIRPLKTTKGHTFVGYHAHWVLSSTDNIIATQNQSMHVLGQLDRTTNGGSLVNVKADPQYAGFKPQVSKVIFFDTAQVVYIDTTGITRIDFGPKMRFSLTEAHQFAVANSGDLRVYVNGELQYGNYAEITARDTVGDTVVGMSSLNTTVIDHVVAIQFDNPLSPYDVVRIEVFPAAQQDMGLHAIPVRTIEDETAFTLAVFDGTQPSYQSMSSYKMVPQAKTQLNQYPVFNTYDALTGEYVGVSNIFKFKETSSGAINPYVQRRIDVGQTGKDFGFEQLLSVPGKRSLAYRNTLKAHGFWYNPDTQVMLKWDGFRWAEKFIHFFDYGYVLTSVHVDTHEPVDKLVHGVWYNPSTNTLQMWDFMHSKWLIERDTVVAVRDPSLQLLWRGGDGSMVAPEFVDSTGNSVPIGSPNGSWSVPMQWTNNISHDIRTHVSFGGLVEHCETIISAQPDAPITSNGAYATLQDEFKFGSGGTIKEYNNSYDTLVSSTMVSTTTPIGVIEFAQQEYDTQTLRIINTFKNSALELLTVGRSTQSTSNFETSLINEVISLFETTDLSVMNYVDSTAYSDGIGMKGWIATAPMLGLSKLVYPVVNTVEQAHELLCHDGHRVIIKLDSADKDRISRNICARSDARRPNKTYGIVTTSQHPVTYSQMVSTYGTVAPCLYHYRTGGTATLSVFTPYAVSSVNIDPVDYHGNPLPEGTTYFNTTSLSTYTIINGAWVVTALGGDVASLWSVVNLDQMCANILLEVEQRLAARALALNVRQYDYTGDQELPNYNSFAEQRFTQYVNTRSIPAPLVNISYTSSNAFTWNYAYSTVADVPCAKDVPTTGISSWQALYQAWYGTPYPHLEPWVLQGYQSKPEWWDAEYRDTTGTRKWITTMWSNILDGRVPVTRKYPSGIVSTGGGFNDDGARMMTYNYIPVNSSDVVLMNVFELDALLPPYVDTSLTHLAFPSIRSLYNSYSQIVSPYADYSFGTIGPIEWAWRTSSQYVYDKAILSFRVNPVHFLQQTFGSRPVVVSGMPLDADTGTPPSHSSTIFHGSTVDGTVRQVHGINQWYVMFNRSIGMDTNARFYQEWTAWTPRIAYMTGNIVDATSLSVTSSLVSVVPEDYSLLLVNSGVIRRMDVEAFKVNVIKNPPPIIQYNPQAEWILSLSPISKYSTNIKYYAPKIVPVIADKQSNSFVAYSATISTIDNVTRRVFIVGNGVEFIRVGETVQIQSQELHVNAVKYNPVTNITQLDVNTEVVAASARLLINNTRVLPWLTGDMVTVSSTKFVPGPLATDTAYFIIRTGDRSFALAETRELALANVPIDLTTVGTGVVTVAEIQSSFLVMGGTGNTRDVWYHYALNYDDLREVALPYTFAGMQTLINIINGFEAYQKANGINLGGLHGADFDPITGRPVSWAHETERFIDWAYGLRAVHSRMSDVYPIDVDTVTNVMTFTGSNPAWINGTRVMVQSTDTLPVPLSADIRYYIQNTGNPGEFQLTTTNIYGTTEVVDITTPGAGSLSIQLFTDDKTYPQFELNPGRNHVWLDTPTGVLSNILHFPVGTQYGMPTVYDQYDRPLDLNVVATYRGSDQSHICTRRSVPNDRDVFATEYDQFIHIGGVRAYIESYEHVILCSNYTLDGSMLYDPFLGMRIKSLRVEMLKNATYSLKPELGGYYLLGNEFKRNIEGAIKDMRESYSTVTYSRQSPAVEHARALVGYSPKQTKFLNDLSVPLSTQFQFYKGMIGAKGTTAAIDAFVNTQYISDATVDEYWAWKVAEFGDARIQTYPELKLETSDAYSDDVKFKFLSRSESTTDADALSAKLSGYHIVTWNDNSKWVNAPKQRDDLPGPMFFDAQIAGTKSLYFGSLPPTDAVDCWINTSSFSGKILAVDLANNVVAIQYTGSVSVPVDASYCDIAGIGRFKVVDITRTNPTTSVTLKGPLPNTIEVGTIATVHNYAPYALVGGVWTKVVDGSVICTDAGVYVHHNMKADATRFVYRQPSPLVTVFFAQADNPSTQVTENVSQYTIRDSKTIVVDGDARQTVGTSIKFVAASIDNGEYLVDDKIGVVPRTGVTYDAVANQSTITLVNPVSSTAVEGDITSVAYDAAAYTVTQIPTTHAATVNSDCCKFSYDLFGTVIVCAMVPNYSRLSPARILDTKTRAVLQRLSLWDPARGEHSSSVSSIDYISPTDNVTYGQVDGGNTTGVNWKTVDAVGKIWMDTSNAQYLPYYDSIIIPRQQDRLKVWGELAPWAKLAVYEFIESTISPSERDALVQKQQADTSLFQQDKLTGTPRKVMHVRTRSRFMCGSTVTAGQFTCEGHPFKAGDAVVFSSDEDGNGNLPDELAQFTAYYVYSPTSSTFMVKDLSGAIVTTVTTNASTLYVTKAFTYDDWVSYGDLVENVTAIQIIDAKYSGMNAQPHTTFPITMSDGVVSWKSNAARWLVGEDLVNVFVNGATVEEGCSISLESGKMTVTLSNPLTLHECDVLTFVRQVRTLSEADNPTIEDAGVDTIQWKVQYPCNTRALNTGDARTNSNTTVMYYYWITNSTTTDAIEAGLTSTLQPYFTVQTPKDNPIWAEKYGFGTSAYGSVWGSGDPVDSLVAPSVMYRDAILRRTSDTIGDGGTYSVQFTVDDTLRVSLFSADGNIKKTKHEEWQLIRRGQLEPIPHKLWMKMVEAIIGHRVDDESVRVPALEYELYDATYGTSIRYGMGDSQAFVPSQIAKLTIMSYLTDSSNDFGTVDIDKLISENDIDTPKGAKSLFDTMWATLDTVHINNIWFNVLQDALVSQVQFDSLMKTSWISLTCTGTLVMEQT